ncbi:MAG: DUF2207 domain-containing protein [Candidatus Altiarchaeales archaeon]|nr:DUF2207 domain-containing protein [Candidatus Altiarchaeales archaeon]
MRREKALILLFLILTPIVSCADLKKAILHIRVEPDGALIIGENLTIDSRGSGEYILRKTGRVADLIIHGNKEILRPEVSTRENNIQITWPLNAGNKTYTLRYRHLEGLSCYDDICIYKTIYPNVGDAFGVEVTLPDSMPKNETYMVLLPEKNTTQHFPSEKMRLKENNLVGGKHELIFYFPRTLMHPHPEFAEIYHGTGKTLIHNYIRGYGKPPQRNLWHNIIWPLTILFWVSSVLGVLGSRILNKGNPEKHLLAKKIFMSLSLLPLAVVPAALPLSQLLGVSPPPETIYLVYPMLFLAAYFSLLVFHSKRRPKTKPYFKPGEIPHKLNPATADALLTQNPPTPTLKGLYAELLQLVLRRRIKLVDGGGGETLLEPDSPRLNQLSESQRLLLQNMVEKPGRKRTRLKHLPTDLGAGFLNQWTSTASKEADSHGLFSKKIGATLLILGTVILASLSLAISVQSFFLVLLESIVSLTVFWDYLPNRSLKGIRYFRSYMGLKEIMSSEKLAETPPKYDVLLDYLSHSLVLGEYDVVSEVFDEKIPQGVCGLSAKSTITQIKPRLQ